MSFELLRENIKATPILQVLQKEADFRLVSRKEAAEYPKKPGFHVCVTMDLESTFEKFESHVKDTSRIFFFPDLTKLTQMKMHRSKLTLLVPDIVRASVRGSEGKKGKDRVFNATDAYMAVLADTLKRHGVSVEALKGISKEIYRMAEPRKPARKRRKKVTK